MTKEAIRKREYRAKLSDEKKNANRIANAESTKLWRKSGTAEEIESRQQKDALRKQRDRDKLNDEQKAAIKAKENARKKLKRDEAKASKSEPDPNNSAGPPCQHHDVASGSSSMNVTGNSSTILPCCNDETLVENSEIQDKMQKSLHQQLQLSP